MGCFKFPDNLIENLERSIRNFWWDDKEKSRIHWLNWRDMCVSKRDGGMGFRDLKAFNLALLAKQAWRILVNPDSLIARLYKARYFRSTTFLGAKVDAGASFTWKCIAGSRIVLTEGIQWRIGNGRNVKIWGDRWLLRPHSFCLMTPPLADLSGACVDSLIDRETGSWDPIKISQFWPVDQHAIKQIPVGDQCNEDVLVWHYSKNGIYSVRSAYHLITTRGIGLKVNRGASSSNVQNDWTCFWQLVVPNKIKVFIWRVCRKILPTGCQLRDRHLNVDFVCAICDGIEEDTIHVLFRCTFARMVWALSLFSHELIMHEVDNIEEKFRRIIAQLNKEDAGRFACICWALWTARNDRFHNGLDRSPLEVLDFAINYHQCYLNAISREPKVPGGDEQDWTSPHEGCLKINFDGVVFTREDAVGMGAVVRDASGTILAWRQSRLQGLLSPACAEALAAKMSLEFAKERGWTNIILEGDCSAVIGGIEDNTTPLAEHGVIIDDIRRLARGLASFQVNLIRRNANMKAHQIAREATGCFTWVLN